MTPAVDKLLTPADLAEVLGTTEAKVMEWNRVYKWPRVRFGRTFRWTPAMVEQITRTHTVVAGKVVTQDGLTKGSKARTG